VQNLPDPRFSPHVGIDRESAEMQQETKAKEASVFFIGEISPKREIQKFKN